MSSRPEEEAVAAGNEIETGDDDRNSAASSGNRWAQGERESLMVVATFVAAAAFQAGINPPGGVWQDDGDPRYEAGKSIMAAKNEFLYVTFIAGATLCLAASLTQLVMLLSDFSKAQLSASRYFLYFTMGTAIAGIAVAYESSVRALTPPPLIPQVLYVLGGNFLVSLLLLSISFCFHKIKKKVSR